MLTPKKRKAKSTLFKSAASSPFSLRPRPDTEWRPIIAQMIEAFVVGVEHLGISLSALIAEFNRYFEALAFSRALEEAWSIVARADKMISVSTAVLTNAFRRWQVPAWQ